MRIHNNKSLLPNSVDPKKISIIAICEAFPENIYDYFYSHSNSSYTTNTVNAFNNAGIKAKSIDDLVRQGIYLTVAVKEPKKGIIIPSKTIDEYSYGLEEELDMFPNIKAIILMGDVAIKAINYISKRKNNTKAIPAGSTYKIRCGIFYFRDVRVFPSYLPTGKNFLIEKSKREMVTDDIKNALALLKQ